MTSRTSTKVITFDHPFSLAGVGEVFVPGDYLVETDEESVDSMSMLPWRRVATSIYVHTNGVTRVIAVNPAELEALLEQDNAQRVQ